MIEARQFGCGHLGCAATTIHISNDHCALRYGCCVNPGFPCYTSGPNPHPKSLKFMPVSASVFSQSFFHGTKADLKPGDLFVVGHKSNFADGAALSWAYFSATLDAAIWGAELARGNGRERIYVVEPAGHMEDDPNLADKKFPGNPTLSYRSREPLRIIAEVTAWQGHSPEQVQQMKDGLARLNAENAANIID
jgi:hypothetical protein